MQKSVSIGLIQNVIAILLGLKLMNYLYFKNMFCCVIPVMNRPDGQTKYTWKQTEDWTSERLNATVRLELLHQACYSAAAPGSKTQIFLSVITLHVSVPIIS